MSNPAPSLPASVLAVRVLLPFAAGYFLSYLYRTVNAVLAPEIVRAVQLDAAATGLMTGAYFLSFAAFQLPLGLLLDRFGPRRVESLLLLFAAAGAFAFSMADQAETLVMGRALVGFGVSSCLMAALKANVQWFKRESLPLMNGIILSAGGLGAVAATAPVQAALAITDWRGVYAVVGVLTLASAAFLFLAVPDREAPQPAAGGPSLGSQVREVLEVFRHPLFLRVAPVGMFSQASFMAIQGLWAGPWLRDVAGLASPQVAAGLTAMAAAMAVGFLSWGAIAERLGRVGVPPVAVSAVGMGAFWAASVAMALGVTWAPLLLCVVYGFTGSSGTLNYAVLTQAFPPRLAGRVNTSLNMVVFVAAFATQWGLGALIGLWPKGESGWPPEAYMVAFGLPMALKAAAFLWFMPAARRAPAG